MNAHTELTWWTSAQLCSMAFRLDEVVDHWRRDWRARDGFRPCVASNAHGNAAYGSSAWLRLGDGHEPTVWLDTASLTVDGVCADLFGASSALSREVGAHARRDLLSRLCPQTLGRQDPEEVAVPEINPWAGFVDLTVPFSSRPARFLLNTASAIELVPRSKSVSALPPPSSVMEALHGVGTSLQVRLTDVELDLSDLETLQTGDLVVLDHPVTQPLSIHSPGNPQPLPCDAFLGKIGECKAVQLHLLHNDGAHTHESDRQLH